MLGFVSLPSTLCVAAAAREACTSLGTVAVKGRSEPIRLWGAAGPDPAA